ncbi:MAG: hypothetical protein GY874_18950 [Desulfobacteraceae bacterium]|nr:hypothetical protein [Desulfobacteraceae bacterium]
MSKNKNLEYKKKLRHEAYVPVLNQLSVNRKTILFEIARKIKNAHDYLNSPNEENVEKKAPTTNVYYYRKPEYSNVIFIDGKRGTGKTSLLYSLIHAFAICLEKSKGGKCMQKDCTAKDPEINELFCHNIEKLKESVFFLKPLELESLPNSTNLLASIFTRLNEAVTRNNKICCLKQRSYPEKSFYMRHENSHNEAIMKLQQVQKSAAFAWEGNLAQRASQIDLDTFAVDTLRSENARVDLTQKFNEMLEDLAKEIFENDTMFILPIDDFDLNFRRFYEMMHLLDLIRSPRLLTIILGDINLCRRLLYQKIKNDFYLDPTKCSNFVALKNGNNFFDTFAYQQATGTINKNIPHSHIFKIGFFESHLGDENISESIKEIWGKIKENLEQFEVKIKTSGDRKINFYKFLNIEGQKDAYFYAKWLFKVSYRKLIDFNIILEREIQRREDGIEIEKINKNYGKVKPNSKGLNVKKIFKDILSESIYEDVLLAPNQKDNLLSALSEDFKSKKTIQTENLILKSDIRSKYEIPLKFDSISNETPPETALTFYGIAGWDIYFCSQNNKNKKKYHNMSDRTGSCLALYHDLLAFQRPSGIIGKTLIEKAGDLNWVYAKWGDMDDSIKISWLIPPFKTFWEAEPFRICWDKCWKKSEACVLENSEHNSITKLLTLWIYIGTKIIYKLISSSESQSDPVFEFGKFDSIAEVLLRQDEAAIGKLAQKSKQIVFKKISSTIDRIENIINSAIKEMFDKVGEIVDKKFKKAVKWEAKGVAERAVERVLEITTEIELAELKELEKEKTELEERKTKLGKRIAELEKIEELEELDCKEAEFKKAVVEFKMAVVERKNIVEELEKSDRKIKELEERITKLKKCDSGINELEKEIEKLKKSGTQNVKLKGMEAKLEDEKEEKNKLLTKGARDEFKERMSEIINNYKEKIKKNIRDEEKQKVEEAFENAKNDIIRKVEPVLNVVSGSLSDKNYIARIHVVIAYYIKYIISNSNIKNIPQKNLAHGWIANLLCTLAPESGINSKIFGYFELLYGQCIRHDSIENIAMQVRRIRTNRAIEFFKHRQYDLALKLFEPTFENRKKKKTALGFNNLKNNVCPRKEDILYGATSTKDPRFPSYEEMIKGIGVPTEPAKQKSSVKPKG